MRIVQANAVYDPTSQDIRTRCSIAYYTLTEWSTALAAAGAAVTVVQRFQLTRPSSATVSRYWFVTRSRACRGCRPSVGAARVHRRDRRANNADVDSRQRPDLSSTHRRRFARARPGTRRSSRSITAVSFRSRFRTDRRLATPRWRRGLALANAVSFTAADQARAVASRLACSSGQQHRRDHRSEHDDAPGSRGSGRAAISRCRRRSPLILWVGRADHQQGSADGARWARAGRRNLPRRASADGLR